MEPSMATIAECLNVASNYEMPLDVRIKALARMIAMVAEDNAQFGINYPYGNDWPKDDNAIDGAEK